MKIPRDPAWLGFLLQLSIDTYIDELAFTEWVHLNRNDLRLAFNRSGEPSSGSAEWTFGIWARQQFRARTVPA